MEGDFMIVCLREVVIPNFVKSKYLKWILDGKCVRQRHGLLAEWVIEPSDLSGDAMVITVWPSHEIFDLWIDTPDRDALTKSEVHQSVSYRPLRRYDLIDGYTNVEAFASLFGGPVVLQEIEEE